MNIKGKKVTFRAIEESDLDKLHQWANDPEIWNLLGGWHFPISKKDQKTWFDNLSANSDNQRFAIESDPYGLIGTTNLVEINWKDGNAFTGIMIGNKETRGKGLGLDSIMTMMRYAFEDLRLNRLDTTIIEYNKPSLNIYLKKCGWKKEGIKRNWYFRKGKFWNQIIIGILKEEYFELIKSNQYWPND